MSEDPAPDDLGETAGAESELARVTRIAQVAGFDIDLTGPPLGRRSPEYRRLHGLPDTLETESHADWLARLHPQDRDRADRTFREALRQGDVYACEYRIVRPSDGAVRWIAARGEVARDASGRAVRLVGAHLDVTERKQAELALAASEARYALALEGGQMGSWRWDLRTDAVEWDARYFRLLGLDPTTDAASPGHVAARLHESERERCAKDIDRIRTGEWDTYWAEYQFVVDGAVRWIATRARLERTPDGAPAQLYGLSWDITARRLDQERLQALVHELNHRVKNTLAIVQSIAHHTLASAEGAQASAKLRERLRALVGVHDLLTKAHWTTITMETLAELAVAAFGARCRRYGPRLWLDPATAVSLALALHELAANAAQHGAISAESGTVELSWEQTAPGAGEIMWRERGGPPCAPPTREGLGLRLIKTACTHDRAGPRFEFAPEGLTCILPAALRAAEA